MKLKPALIAGGVALLGIGVVTATTLSIGQSDGAYAAEAVEAAGATFVGYRQAGWGRHWGRRRGAAGMLCSDMRTERVEDAIAFVENFMAFTPEQRAAWDQLAGSVRESNMDVEQACAQVKELRAEDSAPARLALAELFMSTGLDVVRKVRPAFDDWYATLSEKQQKALDDLMKRRHHRRG